MITSSKLAPVMDFVREELSQRLKIPADQIRADSNLIALGLQSIEAVMLCGAVEEHLSIELDPSTIFEHDTVGSFAEEVLRRLDA